MSFVNFDKVEVLSCSSEAQFLGESLNYRNKISFTISGNFLSLSNFQGVGPIFTSMSSFLNSVTGNFQTIRVNGFEIANAKVLSISVDGGNWVRQAKYSAEIEAYENVDLLSQAAGPFFPGSLISSISSSSSSIENFSEDFSYSIENGSFSYAHSINVEYDSPNGINLAKAIASSIFSTNSAFGIINSSNGNFYNFPDGFIRFSESYDKSNNSCSFTKTFSSQKSQTNEFVKVSESVSSDINEDGIVTMTYSANLRSNSQSYALRYSRLNSEILSLKGSAFSVCNGSYSLFRKNPSYSLSNIPIEQSISIDQLIGSGSISVSFTDDPKIDDMTSLQLSISIAKGADGIVTATEDGSISAIGNKRLSSNWTKVKERFSSVISGTFGRVSGFYSSRYSAGALNHYSFSEKRSPTSCTLSYSRVYSTDTKYLNDPVFSSISITVSTKRSVPSYGLFFAPGRGQVIQRGRNSETGARNTSVTVTIKPDMNFLSSVSAAISMCRSYSFPYGCGIVTSEKISISFSSRSVSVSTEYPSVEGVGWNNSGGITW